MWMKTYLQLSRQQTRTTFNSCSNCQKYKIRKTTVFLYRLCFCASRTTLWTSQRLLGWQGTTCRAASRDLAAMQKSSGLLSIDQPDCVSAHPLYFLRQKKMVWDDPTRHVTPSGAAPVENGAPDKWVCGDEQLMEWLAKVMTTGGGRRREAGGWWGEGGGVLYLHPCPLISIWSNAAFCKWLTTSAKGQPPRCRPNPSLGPDFIFSISWGSDQPVGWSAAASNWRSSTCYLVQPGAKLDCMLHALKV